MQQVSSLARRYARALFRSCGGELAKAKSYLTSFAAVTELYSIGEAADVLNSPVMPKDLKENLLNFALGKAGSVAELSQFVKTVSDAGRIADLPAIIIAFSNLIDQADSRVSAEVVSVVPLSESVISNIKSIVGNGKNVELKNTIDKSILGGVVFKIGDNIVDLSFKSKLNDIAKSAL